VPAEFQEAAVMDAEGDESQVTITGLLRPSEPAGFMTPAADTSNRTEWVRDTARMAAMVDPALAPIAPFYVDLPAGPAGELPQGGETVVEFPNNHLGYAYTWFGFAIVAVVMLGYWLWRERHPTKV
jgi:surfeit locus 1 family protein